MSYSVILSNGTELRDLRLSGNCFVSKVPVSAETFSGGLDRVTISGTQDGIEPCAYELGEHKAMELGRVFTVSGEWYFWLEEPSTEELRRLKDRADIEYIAMMTGVEL
ncbi:MAG: hypothetical protein IJS39_12610 [Synergistaceae bacterium]|nr:hypothetical protein [Synergistaceae bacterium]